MMIFAIWLMILANIFYKLSQGVATLQTFLKKMRE